MGNKIKRNNRKSSTAIKTVKRMVLAVGFSQRKYSTKIVKIKYTSPSPTKKMVPLTSSLV
jgi:hypothetical protein